MIVILFLPSFQPILKYHPQLFRMVCKFIVTVSHTTVRTDKVSMLSLQDIRQPLHSSFTAFFPVWRFQLPSGHAESGSGTRISPSFRVWLSLFLTLFPPLLTRRRQHLSTSAQAQTVKKSSSDEVERIIWEEKDNDHQVSRVAAGRTAADCL